MPIEVGFADDGQGVFFIGHGVVKGSDLLAADDILYQSEERLKQSEKYDPAWFVYILRCGNGALYTGVTTDVKRRVREHASQGRLAARFTRGFAPVELVYSCCAGSKSLAYRMEYRIKKLTREKKAVVVAKNFSKVELLDFLCLNPQNGSCG